jgi:hypothetical protein
VAIEIIKKKPHGFGKKKIATPSVRAHRFNGGSVTVIILVPEQDGLCRTFQGGIKPGDRVSLFIDKEENKFGVVADLAGQVCARKTSKTGSSLIVRAAIDKDHEEFILGKNWTFGSFGFINESASITFTGSEGKTEVREKKSS